MKLPRVTGREVVRTPERAGFIFDRQRGSHVILILPRTRLRVSVPVHAGRTVKIGTLKGMLEDADIFPDDFRPFL